MNEINDHKVTYLQLKAAQSAFDRVASIYDGPFGNNSLIQRMRSKVWKDILNKTPAGANILDLGCGTGIDAVYLAGLGYRVWAVDGSENMVKKTVKRAARHGLSKQVTVMHAGFHELSGIFNDRFDAIYSNFGALNCVSNIHTFVEDCAGLLQDDGLLITNVMGKYCPWEIGFYLLHGRPRRAFVRLSNQHRPVRLGDVKVWTRYYRPRQWYRIFLGRVKMVSYRAMSLTVPPPYLESWSSRHPELFEVLNRWDEILSHVPFFRNMGDHFLMTLKLR